LKEETKNNIIQDALNKKYLLKVCSGCSYPENEDDLIYFKMIDYNQTHDCSCGTMLIWNPLLEINIKKYKDNKIIEGLKYETRKE
jgi:hypothetical protein